MPEWLLSIRSRYVGAAVGVERVRASWLLITMKFHGKVQLFISWCGTESVSLRTLASADLRSAGCSCVENDTL